MQLRAAGVSGDGTDDEFLARALDIYFRGERLRFCVSARAAAQRTALGHATSLGSSLSVRRARLSAAVTGFEFTKTALPSMVKNCARNVLKSELQINHIMLHDPRAGHDLKRLQSARQTHIALTRMMAAYEPSQLDERMWSLIQ